MGAPSRAWRASHVIERDLPRLFASVASDGGDQAARRSCSRAGAARRIGVKPPGPSPLAWRLSMTINATVIATVTTPTSNPTFSPKSSQATKHRKVTQTSNDGSFLRVAVSIPDLIDLGLVVDHVETAKHVEQDSQPTVAPLRRP
jgi:hypothetical protein